MTACRSVKLKSKVFKECKASWWVGVFILFTYMLVLKTSHVKEEEIAKLMQQLTTLNHEKSLALKSTVDLSCQIESQKDPLFVEKMLMKKLGVVPEGQVKVRFK